MGEVLTSGSVVVFPQEPTTYTLRCIGENSTEVELTVEAISPELVLEAFSIQSGDLFFLDEVRFEWSLNSPATCTLSVDGREVASLGPQEVSFSYPLDVVPTYPTLKTFESELFCENEISSTSQTTTQTVQAVAYTGNVCIGPVTCAVDLNPPELILSTANFIEGNVLIDQTGTRSLPRLINVTGRLAFDEVAGGGPPPDYPPLLIDLPNLEHVGILVLGWPERFTAPKLREVHDTLLISEIYFDADVSFPGQRQLEFPPDDN